MAGVVREEEVSVFAAHNRPFRAETQNPEVQNRKLLRDAFVLPSCCPRKLRSRVVK